MKAGKNRKPRRIQEALDEHEKSFAEVARDLGISRSLVTETAHGSKNNRNVLKYFLALGIDHKYLDLPQDLQAQ